MKNNKHRIFLLLGILTLVIGSIRMEQLKPTIDISEYNSMGIVVMLVGLSLIFVWAMIAAVKAEKRHDTKIENGVAPIFESDCTHISGLAAFVAEGTIQVFTDRLEFSVGGTQYTLPIERIVSADILTQKQTEYVTNTNFGRTLLAGLIFGELGALISIERSMKEKEVEITEENLVITYEKDEEAKFIALKNLPCEKVIRAIKQNVHLQPQHVDL